MALTQGWVEVTPSQFPFEAEGLSLVRDLLPDEPPFRAWSNFEFRDNQGKWHEVDLVVLGRRRMHLVELKYWAGTIKGDDHIWRREGRPATDSPLKLARRKAQRLAGKLTDELHRLAQHSQAKVPDPKAVVPFVQEAVFLHHPATKCLLPVGSRKDIFGLDGRSTDSLLPGIGERLLEPAESDPKWSIGANRSAIVSKLMSGIGAVQRRQREAGSWIIDEEPLDEGTGWQDWPAFQRVTQDRPDTVLRQPAGHVGDRGEAASPRRHPRVPGRRNPVARRSDSAAGHRGHRDGRRPGVPARRPVPAA